MTKSGRLNTEKSGYCANNNNNNNTMHPTLKQQLRSLTIKDQDFVNIEYLALYPLLGYTVIMGFDQ